MTPEKVLAVANMYCGVIVLQLSGSAEEILEGYLVSDGEDPVYQVLLGEDFRETSLRHALWMCKKIPELAADKQNRWLGFVQGILWANGVFTIGEMRGHNRS
jgi:hypothetical protein